MKKISLLIALMLFTVTMSAQREWSFEVGVGHHTIADEVSDLEDNTLNLNATIRYSFNETFGLGLYGGYDDLTLVDFRNQGVTDVTYWRANIEGVVDIMELVNLNNNYFTLLAHGGPGISHFGNDYNEYTPNLSGGLTGLFKVTKRVALKLDWTTTGHFNQDKTFDGLNDVTNVGIQSFISNASVGIAFYLGKSEDDSKEHYDWYTKVEEEEENPLKTELEELEAKIMNFNTNNNNINNIVIHEKVCCEDTFVNNIYFQENSDKIEIHALNELQRVADYLVQHPEVTLDLVGSACTTHGSEDYNQKLSERRALNVYNKLLSMGVSDSKLNHWGVGKDKRYEGKPNSDLAKRVELRIKK